jgi:chromosomal replication initiator protein
MKNNLQNSNSIIDRKINWQIIQTVMKEKFGHDIFESWLKKIELVDEFKNYILISVSTRFIRDWITSRYLDQILGIVSEHKKDIIRIEFLIEDINKSISNDKEKIEKNNKAFSDN